VNDKLTAGVLREVVADLDAAGIEDMTEVLYDDGKYSSKGLRLRDREDVVSTESVPGVPVEP
jgi:hypothetical protein